MRLKGKMHQIPHRELENETLVRLPCMNLCHCPISSNCHLSLIFALLENGGRNNV
jgi:hypothetical protein